MPPAPARSSGPRYIVLNQFETMDTQNTRFDLARDRLAWLENLQPIGRNRLQIVPAALAAMATLTGEAVQKLFFANYNSTDYIIAFCASGAAYQVNAGSGSFVKFANAGTFSNADMTQWQSSRILIADPTVGYSTWDGTAFVKPGGVSPNIVVTAPGSGYAGGATAAITGGSGSGATASVQVVGGAVVGLTLTNAGSGFKAGDTLTVTISPVSGGSGATASAKVWPIFSLSSPTTIAVFQGRVWLAGGRQLTWTGTGGYDDSASANASGSTTLSDADLVHQITALRALNNYLYIFGDNSIKQIGTIQVSGSTTLFAIITLSSDQGTIFPLSIVSYNRLILFANKVGVYAVFGASVEKISNEMDGVFQAIDFTQPLQAALNDISNIHCYLLLVRYIDPVQGVTRSILLTFMNKKWFVASQGSGLAAVCSAVIAGTLETFGSSSSDVTQLLQSKTTPVSFLLSTALSQNNEPHTQKRTSRIGVSQTSSGPGIVTATSDSENNSLASQYNVATVVAWQNASVQTVTFVNGTGSTVTFVGTGFTWARYQGKASGLALGATLSGILAGYTINGIIIEYNDGPEMVSTGAV